MVAHSGKDSGLGSVSPAGLEMQSAGLKTTWEGLDEPFPINASLTRLANHQQVGTQTSPAGGDTDFTSRWGRRLHQQVGTNILQQIEEIEETTAAISESFLNTCHERWHQLGIDAVVPDPSFAVTHGRPVDAPPRLQPEATLPAIMMSLGTTAKLQMPPPLPPEVPKLDASFGGELFRPLAIPPGPPFSHVVPFTFDPVSPFIEPTQPLSTQPLRFDSSLLAIMPSVTRVAFESKIIAPPSCHGASTGGGLPPPLLAEPAPTSLAYIVFKSELADNSVHPLVAPNIPPEDQMPQEEFSEVVQAP